MSTPGRPRLVATDLDGTIVRADGTISDRTVRALDGVAHEGVPVVFVTGRPYRWLAEVVERTGHTGLAVCANGGLVYDLSTDEVVETFPMAAEVGREVARLLRDSIPGVAFAVETSEGFSRETTYRTRYDAGVELAIEDDVDALLHDPVVKLLVRHEEIAADPFLAQAREVVGELAELTHSSTTGLLEISAAGVSKATTLARLCDERGIEASDVVAFGDMPNDLPLLAWAGQAYAVANAHPEVLAAVTRRAGGVEQDGVAEVLERLFALPRVG